MNKSKTREITFYAVMLALMFAATAIDKLYSSWMPFSMVTVSICVLCTFVTVQNKPLNALLAGIFFGLVSFVYAFVFPSILSQNPLISILPRAFVGITGYGAYKLFQLLIKRMRVPLWVWLIGLAAAITAIVLYAIFVGDYGIILFIVLTIIMLALAVSTIIKKSKNSEQIGEIFSLSIGAAFAVLTNTFLFLSSAVLFGNAYGSLVLAYASLTITHLLPEFLAAVIVTPYIVLGVRRGLRLDTFGTPKKKRTSAVAGIAVNTDQTTVESDNKENKINPNVISD